MADIKLKSDKVHQRYYNAERKRLPGVTTITGVLDKPALKAWANRIGLDGIDMKSYVDKRAEMGTCAHDIIEAYLNDQKIDKSEWAPVVVDQAENSLLSFLNGIEKHEYKVIATEQQMISEQMQIGGTCDIIWEWDGVPTLTDLKTGKGIYPEMFCQAIAYAEISKENGYPIEQVSILNVPRAEDEEFSHVFVKPEHYPIYKDIFLNCLAIYQLKKKVKWY